MVSHSHFVCDNFSDKKTFFFLDIHLHFTSYPGNDHFKNKEYYDALDQYDQALDDLTHFSVAHDNSEVTLLTTMVRNNRLIIIGMRGPLLGWRQELGVPYSLLPRPRE